MARLIRLERWSNITYFCQRHIDCINLVQKVLPGIFLGYVLYAGGTWKRDIMVADNEELEKMDAFQIHAMRTPKGGDTFIFSVEDGTVKLSGGDQVLRTSTLIRDNPDRGEEQGNLPGESEAFTNTSFKWRT